MKKTKSIISAFLCLLMVLGGYSTVYANEQNIGVTETPSYLNSVNENLLGIGEPFSDWNLKTKGTYKIWGSADYSTLYSEYYFTGVESMDIYVYNESKESTITVSVYKAGSVDLLRSSKRIAAGKSASWNVGTKSNAQYYIKFSGAPMTFSGTVSNGG